MSFATYHNSNYKIPNHILVGVKPSSLFFSLYFTYMDQHMCAMKLLQNNHRKFIPLTLLFAKMIKLTINTYQLVGYICMIFTSHVFTNSRLHQATEGG